jgi:DNA gyrase/topoisomerase IV subunit A
MSLKLELDSRPTQEDFDEKVQQCNALRLELSNLTEQMACNEKLLEQMQNELDEERERQMEMLQKHLEERAVQTEAIESTKEVPAEMSASSVLSESPPQSAADATHESSTALPQPPAGDEIDHEADDDALNNHPKVLYEDELIVFKEKCTNLATENIRLQREIGELRANMSHFHNNWLHNFMLKYLVPVLIVFVAYIFYLLK